jgi:exosome complex component RRP4
LVDAVAKGDKLKRIILPGEKIGDSPNLTEATYVEDGKTYASVAGFMDEENRFMPIKGAYSPRPGDNVVGVVVFVKGNGYKVDLNLPFEGFLSGKDTRIPFSMGEVMYGRIKDVDEIGNVDLVDVKKLPPGEIYRFPASKIPRLIGKKNSMVNTLIEGTGCDICIGNNGYVWLAGGRMSLAMRAIDMIERKSHMSGLTNEIAEFLNVAKKEE